MIQKQVALKNKEKVMEEKMANAVEKIKIDEKIPIIIDQKESLIEESKEEDVHILPAMPAMIDVNTLMTGNISMDFSEANKVDGSSFLNMLDKEAKNENDVLEDMANMSMLKMSDKAPEDDMAFD